MSPERIEEILAAVRGVRVLVVGDLVLDRYLSGAAERISPEAPVPVVRIESESCGAGGAANVAANVAALGAACEVVGVAGADADGETLLDLLRGTGVGTDGVVLADDRPTAVKTRVLAHGQQVVRFDREVERDVPADVEAALVERVRSLVSGAGAVVLEDYDKGTLVPAVIAAALEGARGAAAPTVVDPKRRRFFSYAGATLFKPNARELADALGEPPRPDDAAWMAEVRRRVGCDHLLVTLGAGGMALATACGELLRIAAGARGVYDVSGAGDTAAAAAAVALAAGAGPIEAAVLADRAAAVEVGRPGVSTVRPGEILDHVRRADVSSAGAPAGATDLYDHHLDSTIGESAS